jgi:hypothetical protein
MPLEKYVRKPSEIMAIQWVTDQDKEEIELTLRAHGFLVQYDPEQLFQPEHIHFMNFKGQGILQKDYYLVYTEDDEWVASDPETFDKRCMEYEKFASRVTSGEILHG